MQAVGAVATLPLYRPLVGDDKQEILAGRPAYWYVRNLERAVYRLLPALHAQKPRDFRQDRATRARPNSVLISTRWSRKPWPTPSARPMCIMRARWLCKMLPALPQGIRTGAQVAGWGPAGRADSRSFRCLISIPSLALGKGQRCVAQTAVAGTLLLMLAAPSAFAQPRRSEKQAKPDHLTIVNAKFLDSEDGYPLPAGSSFYPGEQVYVVFNLDGFHITEDEYQMKVSYRDRFRRRAGRCVRDQRSRHDRRRGLPAGPELDADRAGVAAHSVSRRGGDLQDRAVRARRVQAAGCVPPGTGVRGE